MEESPLRLTVDTLLIIFICGLILRLARPVFFPFFLAIFLYYLFSPLLDLSAQIRIPRPIAIALLVMFAFALMYFLGVLIYTSGKALANKLPSYSDQFSNWVNWAQSKLEQLGIAHDRFFFLETFNFNRLANIILSSLGTFLSFLTRLLLILVFLFFMLAGRGKLKQKVAASLKADRAQSVANLLEAIDREIQKYLVIKTLVSLISGSILALILTLFGVDFALMFGLMAFLLNYIPSIGSIVAVFIPTLYTALQFGSLWRALWVLLLLVATDFLIANVLEPKIMGQSLGLSPLAVLFSLFFWGWLWGIPGMILAVPILATLKIIADHFPSLRWVSTLLGR